MEALPLLNNRYKLMQSIGRGGMAHVYSGYDLTLDRPVAVKILKEDLSADPAFRDRFHQEAKAAANLSHPNIVTVHDFGLDQGRLFIVMEHIPGVDLKTLIIQKGRLPLDEAIPLIIQACSGIGYAHRAGLVHCDIKPQNMLVTPDKRLKVTDFGIARALASISPDERNDEIWGSPQYFSPEQASGSAPQPASDVYSIGVVMYELLTGQPPFYAESAQDYADMHLRSIPVNPEMLNDEIPPELDAIIMKVLSKEPVRRYRTADQLGRVLQSYFRPTEGNKNLTPLPEFVHEITPETTFSQVKPAQETPELIDQLNAIDWVTIGLGLLTVAAVGGLIPLWIAVLFNIL
jgi:serine/threonine-protein kinase